MPTIDRREQAHFDVIGAHFLKNIHGRCKGRIRMAVLQRDLAPFITAGRPLRLLDAGGGAGHMTSYLLALGHHVTLVDQSQHLLRQASERVTALGLAAHFTAVEGDLTQQAEWQRLGYYDGVCCHAVVEWLDNAEQALQGLLAQLKAGGFFSLMYYNCSALRFIHHVYANFDYIDQGLHNKNAAKLTPSSPRTRKEIDAMFAKTNTTPYSLTGVRCFYDYMKQRDRDRHSEDELIARELVLSQEIEYLPVARYIHDVRILRVSDLAQE